MRQPLSTFFGGVQMQCGTHVAEDDVRNGSAHVAQIAHFWNNP